MKKLSLFLLTLCFVFNAAFTKAAEKVTVFAAASTTNMMDELLGIYNAQGGNAAGSYAGSGALAKQIESGAPAAIFISANQDWADYLDKKGMSEPGTRKNLVGNTLVLIGQAGNKIRVDLTKNPDLVKILNGGKLVIGAPESVPAGKYAKDAFIKLGLWEGLQKNIASVENVRVALAFVSRGEAVMGVVFGTDAASDKNVSVIDVFPANTHDEISYPILMVKGKSTPEAKKLYDFLNGPKAKEIYKKYGFKAY